MSKLRTRYGVEEKRCSYCRTWKPLTDFSPGGKSHGSSEGGRHCECRACNAARHRRRYAAAKTHRGAMLCGTLAIALSWAATLHAQSPTKLSDPPNGNDFISMTNPERNAYAAGFLAGLSASDVLPITAGCQTCTAPTENSEKARLKAQLEAAQVAQESVRQRGLIMAEKQRCLAYLGAPDRVAWLILRTIVATPKASQRMALAAFGQTTVEKECFPTHKQN